MTQLIRWMDGFEDIQTSDLPNFYSKTSTVTVAATTPRTGARRIACSPDNSGAFRQQFDSQQFWYVGYAFILGSNNAILSIENGAGNPIFVVSRDGSNHVTLYSGSLGTLRATSTDTIPGGWVHIGVVVKLDTTSGGYCNVYLNGASTPIIAYTGITATANAGDYVNYGPYGWTSGAGTSYDDIVVATGDPGSAAAGFLGDLAIGSMFVDGAGSSTQFTPSAGSNYQNVDDALQDGDSTYNESGTSGHKDLYTLGAPTLSGTVIAVQPLIIAKKDVAGAISFKGVTKLGGTEVAGASRNPGTSYGAYFEDAQTTKPGGGAWTLTDLGNLEAGLSVD